MYCVIDYLAQKPGCKNKNAPPTYSLAFVFVKAIQSGKS